LLLSLSSNHTLFIERSRFFLCRRRKSLPSKQDKKHQATTSTSSRGHSTNTTMTTCDNGKALRVQAAVSEEMEQRRRCLDLGGEALKRSIAKEVCKSIPQYAVLKHIPPPIEKSFLIIIETREEVDLEMASPGILEQGWSALKHAADVVSQATADAMELVGNKTAAVVENLVDRTSIVAETVGHKTSDVVEQIVDTTSHMATQVAHTTGDVASHAAHTTADLGHQLADKTGQWAHTLSDAAPKVMHATSEAAIHLGHQIVDTTSEVASYVGHKFEETVLEFRDDASRLYVKSLEKLEQARRMASGEEQCALLNAMAVSALIADLDFSFYKQCGVNKRYAVCLLESMEVKWRLLHELDGFAQTNAKKEALLIKQHFAIRKAEIETCVPLKVVEVRYFPKNAPFTAAQ